MKSIAQVAKTNGAVLTDLLYVDPESTELHELMGTTDVPLNILREDVLSPGSDALEKINTSFR